MNISIQSYQPSVPAKTPAPESSRLNKTADSAQESASSGTAATGSPSSSTVALSNSAQALYARSSAVERQASMSQSELKNLYKETDNLIISFGNRIADGNYNRKDLLPKTDDPERMALGQKSLDYAIALSRGFTIKQLQNPFEGMSRNDLSAIVYDNSGTYYTEAERYVADVELQKQDYKYFSELSTKLTNGGDNREFFKGVLDHFDNLSLVEKAHYPDGYRDTYQKFYDEEEKRWGPLALIKKATEEDSEEDSKKPSDSIFREGQTPEELMQALLEKTIELKKA